MTLQNWRFLFVIESQQNTKHFGSPRYMHSIRKLVYAHLKSYHEFRQSGLSYNDVVQTTKLILIILDFETAITPL